MDSDTASQHLPQCPAPAALSSAQPLWAWQEVGGSSIQMCMQWYTDTLSEVAPSKEIRGKIKISNQSHLCIPNASTQQLYQSLPVHEADLQQRHIIIFTRPLKV